jgi:hypothetical protein
MPESFPFHHGVFTISTPPGGPTLIVPLTVDQDDSVTGVGHFTQVRPHLDFHVAFHGQVHAVNGPQIYSLHGDPLPNRIGAWNVPQLMIMLNKVWGEEGTANYTYYHGGVEGPVQHVKDARVRVTWVVLRPE